MGGQTGQDQRIGSTLAGYRIERLIGRGGMSVVYLAEQIRLKRRAALKLLAPELADDARFRERFLRESELAASLDHPNVIPIFDAGETGGILYIAMRYVEGQDLRQLIQHDGKLEPEQALRILRPVADALDYAHAHGLVHRDVKPGNILLADDGPVYLSDFGLTRRVDEGASLTEAGDLVGSIDYASPEQIDGRSVDGRADVYSLACVTYECLTGAVPFPRDSPMAKLFAHLQEHAPDPSTVNPALPAKVDAVLEHGLAKDPAARYPTATELVSAVAAALDTGPAPARSRPRRRTLILLAAAALATLGGLAAALALTLDGTNPQPDPILPLTGNSAVRIDAASATATAAVAVHDPGAIAAGLGSVWVIDDAEVALVQIDSKDGKRSRTIALDESSAPKLIAAGEGAVWLGFTFFPAGQNLWKVNPRTGGVKKLARDVYPASISTGQGAVWVEDTDGILRILPRAFTVAATLPPVFETDAQEVAAIGGAGLWVLTKPNPEVPASTLSRLDPASGAVLDQIDLTFAPTDFAVGSRSLWVVDGDADAVIELDPATGNIRSTVRVGRVPVAISVNDEAVWVANARDKTVSRIEPATLNVTTIAVGGTPGDLAAVADGAWVTVTAG